MNIISQGFSVLSNFWNVSVNIISQGFPVFSDFWNIFRSYEHYFTKISHFFSDFWNISGSCECYFPFFQIFGMFLDPVNIISQGFPVLSDFWNISGPCERNFARISCLFRVLEYFWILILQEFSILSDFWNISGSYERYLKSELKILNGILRHEIEIKDLRYRYIPTLLNNKKKKNNKNCQQENHSLPYRVTK